MIELCNSINIESYTPTLTADTTCKLMDSLCYVVTNAEHLGHLVTSAIHLLYLNNSEPTGFMIDKLLF